MSSTDQEETSPARGIISTRLDEQAYRPISGMAVFCLLLSVVGLASFLNYYLIALALIILILSIVTSIRLDRAKEEYGGQLIAKLAILVGLVGTLGAGTSHVVQHIALTREARAFAESYLAAVLADDLEEAFRLRMAPQARAIVNDNVKDLLFQYNKEFEAFKKEKVTQVLRAGGKEALVEFKGNSEVFRMEGLSLVGVDFHVTLPGNPPKKFATTIGVHGGVSYVGDWEGRQWYIRGNEAIAEIPIESSTKTEPSATAVKAGNEPAPKQENAP